MRCPRESPTALVAMRATARIRVRCIPWSAVVEDVVGNNAARVSTVRSVGAQTGELSSAWGNKKCFYRIRFSCSNLNRISPLHSALQASRRLTVRFIFGYVFRWWSRHYRAAPAREHDPDIVVTTTARALQLGESRACTLPLPYGYGKKP
jgi:hypothetical protein